MPWDRIESSFDFNVRSVRDLLGFDHIIIDVAVDGLRALAWDLEQQHHLHRAVTLVNNRASLLANIKADNSLRPKYEVIFNQCVVLLVSYFDSAVHSAFREGVVMSLRLGADVPVAHEALSVSWHGLERTEGEREAIFADLLVAQKNISFQDMKSVARAFGDLLTVQVDRTPPYTDNIILGQAARHVIVHAGSIVDTKMTRQISAAKTRTIKPTVTVGERIRFSPEEVLELGTSMTAYLHSLCSVLKALLGV